MALALALAVAVQAQSSNTLRGYEACILLPVLVHIHSLALHCYRWRGFEYKCSSWYPDLNGFWRPLVALAASSARAPARMPQGM